MGSERLRDDLSKCWSFVGNARLITMVEDVMHLSFIILHQG